MGEVRYAGEVPGGALAGGTFVAPHIIELDDPARLTREVFGPILHVVRWKAGELDRLIDAIAATGYGLTLGIHTRIDETVAADRGAAAGRQRLCQPQHDRRRRRHPALRRLGPLRHRARRPAARTTSGASSFEQVVSTNTAAAGGNASLIAMDDG